MFGFLKDKLKKAINKFSKDVDEESEEIIEESIEPDKDESKEKYKEEKKVEEIKKSEIKEVKQEEKVDEKEISEIKEQIKEEVEKFQEEKEEKKIIEEKVKEKKVSKKEDKEQEKIEEKTEQTIDEKKTQIKSELEKPLIVEDDEVKDVKDKLPKPKKLKEEVEIEKIKDEEKEDTEVKIEKKSFFQKIKDKITPKDEKDKKEFADIKKTDEEIDESKEQSEPEEEKDKTIELKKDEEPDDDDSVEMIIEDDVIKKEEDIDLKEEEEKIIEKIEDEVKKYKEEKPEKKKGFFSKLADSVTKTSISESKFNDLFWKLEIVLLENNVAVEVIDKIKKDLREELVTKKARIGKTQDVIIESLQKTINSLFDVNQIDLFEEIKKKKPYVIIFVGVNGVGKTTTIAKLANKILKNNKTCVMAAGDTFRAAAIQQLEEHAKNLNVRLISHDYGSDPSAVAFDAIKYADAKGIDVVLIDTAGRQHSNSNLMEEMKKIQRVTNPDLKIFVGESITGNDCIEQAKAFNDSIGIDAMILSKADVDEKGGAAISISYVTKKPILYIGTGQEYDSLKRFDKKIVTENLNLK